MLGTGFRWFLVVLLVKYTYAALDSIYGWTIDDSCEPWVDDLNIAFRNASYIVSQAFGELEIVRQQRESSSDADPSNWNRINRNLRTLYGFVSDPDKNHDEEREPPWDLLYEVWKPINDAFFSQQVVPSTGWWNLVGGPTIYCNSSIWEWIDIDEEDPTDPAHRTLRETKLPIWEVQSEKFEDVEGAWYYQGRFHPEQKQSPIVPTCATGQDAATERQIDAIQFCFDKHQDDPLPPAFPSQDSVVEGTRLDHVYQNLAFVLVHESTHWYSTDQNDVEDMSVGDYDCIDEYGEWRWRHNETGAEISSWDDPGEHYVKVISYGAYCCFNLAWVHPDLARQNADNYALFAAMSLYNDWDWATGEALPISDSNDGDSGNGSEA